MGSPPLAKLFHRQFRRKESERQAPFSVRVSFSTATVPLPEMIYTIQMVISSKTSASASVIVAGVFAVLAGLIAFLIMSLSLFGLLLSSAQEATPELPAFVRTATLGFLGFLLCLAAFGIHVWPSADCRPLVAHPLQPKIRQGAVQRLIDRSRSICAPKTPLPGSCRCTRMVLRLFDFEPALPSLSFIPSAGVPLRTGSFRKSGFDSFDPQLPCLFRLWRRALKAQAMELLPDDRSPGLLAREYRRECAEPELQRRDGLFPKGNAGFFPSA